MVKFIEDEEGDWINVDTIKLIGFDIQYEEDRPRETIIKAWSKDKNDGYNGIYTLFSSEDHEIAIDFLENLMDEINS